MQIVLKISKLCNLRCNYCYEFNELGNPAKMSVDDLRSVFRNLRFSIQQGKRLKYVEFIWHGGEPTLASEEYFAAAIAEQDRILGPLNIRIINSIQTNLYIYSESVRRLLTGKTFQKVGVSLDIKGMQRNNIRGDDSTNRVLSNFVKLRSDRKDVGVITVLSRSNMNDLPYILEYFEERQLRYRVSPIYRSAFAGQNDAIALSGGEISRIYCWLVDRWLNAPNNISAQPAFGYVSTALRIIAKQRLKSVAIEQRNTLLIIDTNGNTYFQADAYDPTRTIGNIFTTDLSNMVDTEGYNLAMSDARRREKDECDTCDYYRYCSGFPVIEATADERQHIRKTAGGCAISTAVLEHTVSRIKESIKARPH